MIEQLWARWKVIAQRIGNVQSRMLLTIFYFLIVMPFGLGVRLFSDPLQLTVHQRPSGAATRPGPRPASRRGGSAKWTS